MDTHSSRSKRRSKILASSTAAVATVGVTAMMLAGTLGGGLTSPVPSASNPTHHAPAGGTDAGRSAPYPRSTPSGAHNPPAPPGTASQESPGSSAPVTLGTPPVIPPGARALGSVSPTTPVRIDVVLEPRTPGGLEQFATDVSTPTSPDYRHYLKPGTFAARFGPSPATRSGVSTQLAHLHLHVDGLSGDGLIMKVSAPAADVERALHVGLERYRLVDGLTVFANNRAPTVSGVLASAVSALVGLSDIPHSVPLLDAGPVAHRSAATGTGAGTGSDSKFVPSVIRSPSVTTSTGGAMPCAAATDAAQTGKSATKNRTEVGWTWNTLATAYGFTSAYSKGRLGAGETIGLYELAAYSRADVTGFEKCYSLPGSDSFGSVRNVAIDGGPGANPGTGEAILDVEDALGLAPEAQVVVYGAPNSTAGSLDEYDRMVSDDQVNVISTSWGSCERDSTPTVIATENLVFEEAAAQGQTVLAAAGDSGAEGCYDPPINTTKDLSVLDPADQPFVTSVGGTDLTSIDTSSTSAPVESVWNEHSLADGGRGLGAGGGGVSEFWSKPAWQSVGGSPAPTGGCSVAPGIGSSTSCRQVPDVAATADPVHADMIYCSSSFCPRSGGWEPISGTSAAAPLWAALTVLADEGCAGGPVGFLNPRLYSMGENHTGSFHDITTGTNDYTGNHGTTYVAGAGWDNASGWGTPNGTTFLAEVCRTSVTSPGVTLTSDAAAGTNVSYTVNFTTSANGALTSGESITLVGPAGTVWPSTASDYRVTTPSGTTVTEVSNFPTGTSDTDNGVLVTLGSPVTDSEAVSLTIRGVTNTPTAGAGLLSVATTTDAAPASAPLTFASGPVTAAASTVIVATPSESVGSNKDRVQVTLLDGSGNPVADTKVAIAANAGTSATITPPSATTSVDGTCTFSISDAVSETVTLTATAGTSLPTLLDATPLVEFTELTGAIASFGSDVAGATTTLGVSFTTPGSGALSGNTSISIVAPPETTFPSAAGDYTVTAQTGAALVTSVRSHSGGMSDSANKTTLNLSTSTITGGDTVTIHATSVRGPTTAGVAHVSVSTRVDPVPVDPTFTVVAGPPSVTRSSVSTAAHSLPADGTAQAQVQVRLIDSWGNSVPNHSVRLTASGHATPSTSTVTSNSTGLAAFGVSDTSAQIVALTATDLTSSVMLPSVDMTFTDLSGLAYTLGSNTAGVSTTATGVFDTAGTIAGGSVISFETLPGTALPTSLDDYAVYNVATGQYAAIDGVQLDVGPGSTTKNVAGLDLGDTAFIPTADVLVVIVEGLRNPIESGVDFASISASGTGNQVAGISTPIVISPGPVSSATSSIVSSPSALAANGTSTAQVSVHLEDQFGNPVADQLTTLSVSSGTHSTVSGDGSTGTHEQSRTGSGGTATFTVTDSTDETVSYAPRLEPSALLLDVTTSVDFSGPSAVQQPTGTLSDPTTGTKDVTLTASFSTSVLGALPTDEPVPPTLTVTASTFGVLPNASSAYQVSDGVSGIDPVIRVTVVGGNTAILVIGTSGITSGDPVSISICGVTVPNGQGTYPVTLHTSVDTVAATAEVPVIAPTPSLSRSTLVALTTSVPANGASSSTIEVTEIDAYGVPVPDDTVDLVPNIGSWASPSPSTSSTSATGTASFTVTDDTVESATFTLRDVTAGVSIGSVTVDFTTPAGRTTVQDLSMGPAPPERAIVAGSNTSAVISFTTSGSGALGSGATISLAVPSDTAFPVTVADYRITGAFVATITHLTGTGTNSTPFVLTLGPTTTIPGTTLVQLTVTGISVPTKATANQTVSLATSSDIARLASSPWAIVAGPPIASSAVTASNARTEAGTPVTLTVSEIDAFGNPVVGDTVLLAHTADSHPNVVASSAVTFANGTATFTVTDHSAEAVTFILTDASAGIQFTTEPTVVFTVRASSPTTPGSSPPKNSALGYRLVASDGGIFSYGDARFFGSTGAMALNKPIVGMAATPDGQGYWLVASDGGIFSYGDARFFGSTGAMALNKPIVGMAATPDGQGYWLVASDGGIFSYGDARFFGSTGSLTLNRPIVGMAATPDGQGYWLVASDGGIFSYGDARFFGSTGSLTLNRPIVVMAATPDGQGYWLVASDGGIFSYGDARFFGSTGSLTLNRPIVGMAATPDGQGYWLVASDGGIFSYGDARFFGSTGAMALNKPIVGMADGP